MGIKRYKPTTPSQRFRTASDYTELTASKPEKSLLRPNKHSGGRNNKGRRTAVNVAGGNKTMYRLIDFKRDKIGAHRPGVLRRRRKALHPLAGRPEGWRPDRFK